ncbi:hypothetical protein E8E13_011534 [Curvularia kusanoi]|uniref:Uncharacterized protein n=1 Tax=Curvularia kusanoi TaxID=90978 RepID=A0A9P4TPB5_CURKU|nr:hypothetical protein E8E13_011534 [Curvularia kusanoi]
MAKWLLTNKQIMEEGLDQLCRGSAWHVNDLELVMDSSGRGAFGDTPTIVTPHLLPSQVVHLDLRYASSLAWSVLKDAHIWTDQSDCLGSFFRFYPEAYSHTKTFIIQIGNRGMWDSHFDWVVNPSCRCAGKVSFDLPQLRQQLTACSMLKKFCIQTITSLRESSKRWDYLFPEQDRVGILYDWPRVQPHLQGLADAASSVGKALIEGGQETITDQDNYRGQLENAQNDRAWDREIHWRYTIERR